MSIWHQLSEMAQKAQTSVRVTLEHAVGKDALEGAIEIGRQASKLIVETQSQLWKEAENAASKARCLLAFHQWSEWTSPQEHSCDQERRCERPGCSQVDRRMQHEWGNFDYFEDNNCERRRECGRCDAMETDVAHEGWTDWAPLDSCRQKQTCTRCHHEESRIEHAWAEKWDFASPRSCEEVDHCRRCFEGTRRREGRHDYVFYERIDCQRSKFSCSRCAVTEERPHTLHDFGEWKPYGHGFYERRRCKGCNAEEEHMI
jgi:hypothetical protein